MDTEVLAADSNDAMKDDKPSKVNGELNGSVEGMEVDEESGDGADVATDESVYGSSRAPDGDGDGDPEGFGSEIDGKSTSHFGSEAEGKNDSDGDDKLNDDSEGEEREEKTGSHFGSESQNDGMDVDGIDDADGESVNSEEEDQLLNSETEEVEGPTIPEADNAEEPDSEEEGDINGPLDEDAASVKDDNEAGDGDADETSDPTATPEKGSEAISEQNGPTETPTKKKKKIAEPITPRRSSRTVQKPQRFGQGEGLTDEEEEEEEEEGDVSDGVEEVPSGDPLADTVIDKENHRFPRMIGNTTIVVSDSKRLTDIASKAHVTPKKEPTLVIIDTNSILSGRGGVPMQTAGGVTITQQPSRQQIPMSMPPRPRPPPPILPTLTDDMYVVEAPSFIVPYVYEKPPVKKFKKYLKRMLNQVKKQDEEERKKEEEEEEEERRAEAAAVKKEVDPIEIKSEVETEETEIKKEKVDDDDVDKMVIDESDKSKDEKGEEGKDKEDSTKADESKDETKEDEAAKVAAGKEPITLENIKKEPDEQKTADVSKSKEDAKVDGSSESEDETSEEEKKKPATGSYFDNPLGKFFMQIGMNLVQEFVQTDLLKQQKKKQKAGKGTDETQQAINSLKKNLLLSKENNEPYMMEQTKCEFCSFKTESKLIMAHHLETPHMRNYVYRCNFCPLEVRGPHDILYHMEAEHCVRGRLERAPAFHQCPQCPFEDNQKGKLTRHLMTCGKKFRPEKNLEPPLDWEPPAKIPRLPRKPNAMPMGVNPLYAQQLDRAIAKNLSPHLMPKTPGAATTSPLMRPGRGRPVYPQLPQQNAHKLLGQRNPLPPQLQRGGVMYRNPAAGSAGSPGILPSAYPIANNPLYQQKNPATVKLLNQPSISITPLPRQAANTPQPGIPPARPGQAGNANAKTTFVICEICDGYIKDLEQLRNHMQWIHKVKIHPKMIYNRPPLNCQKCQFRFFTDQGLERHLLGSHGLVTSSMQDQANRGKDGGRCPVCGRVYQWKLLNHVARDHNMTLKPAHLSYKCTVCTATFGMYKQFESHVYSAHSVVAKRVMDKKNGQAPSTSRSDTASLLKPLKINDEITIIPQPAKKSAAAAAQRPVPGNYRVGSSNPAKTRGPDSVQVIDLEDSPNKGENGAESLTAVKERLKRRQSLEIRQLESEGEESESDGEPEPESTKKPPPQQEEEEDDQPTEGESDE